MRLKKIVITPKTAKADEFNAQGFTSTGAATAPTTTRTSDSLAHQVTLIAPVQATLAGITFTIVGTDADGLPQTETGLVGPASGATVTSTKYFKTIETIKPSATMGALTVSVGTAAPSFSATIPIERYIRLATDLTITVTGTVSITIQDSIADMFSANPSTLPWTSITALTAKTAQTDGTTRATAAGVRILTNSVTNGATCTLYISQAAIR